MEYADLVSPFLARPDTLVLEALIRDASTALNGKNNGTANGRTNRKANGKANGSSNGNTKGKTDHEIDDAETITLLNDINDIKSKEFEPTIFTMFDVDLNGKSALHRYLIQPYVRWASKAVRRDTDIVFLTHILTYMFTSVPSAIFLYFRFSWWHAGIHALMTLFYAGPFTLMLHNHIHNNGVLASKYAWFDQIFPYILEPLMGHTWDSYYYHHVKHHHVEGNGPDDLSSTVRYQRDELLHFLHYLFRFMLLVWIELPIYFLRKGRPAPALRVFFSEFCSYALFYQLAKWKFHATLFVFIIPLLQMRIAMMIGNWGQHAFVDDVEPESAFRSSITLIDVTSNRHCFNDGYHTSHHLNPRRHWRDHPVALLKAKNQYAGGRALVFANIDYLMITTRLLMKDYDYLAGRLVPIGEQIGMSLTEIADMLRTKTRRFTEEDIKRKFMGQ